MKYFTSVFDKKGNVIKDEEIHHIDTACALTSLTSGSVKNVSVAFEREGDETTPEMVSAKIQVLDAKFALRYSTRVNKETGEVFKSYYIGKPMLKSAL